MSYSFKQGILEVRWHGRGGQGAITSAQILAEAAYHEQYKGITAAPSFGAERRGVPVTASTRLSLEPVRLYSQIEYPDVVVVLDETLLHSVDVTSGLKKGGWLVVNTPKEPRQTGMGSDFSVATADATGIAEQLGLVAMLP